MQRKPSTTVKRIMSIEEYVKKQKRIQEKERKKFGMEEEKSPAWMVAELYG